MSYLSLIKAKDAPFAPTGRKTAFYKARILCSPSTKQCLRTTPGAHFAFFERKTAPRTHSPGAFRALRA